MIYRCLKCMNPIHPDDFKEPCLCGAILCPGCRARHDPELCALDQHVRAAKGEKWWSENLVEQMVDPAAEVIAAQSKIMAAEIDQLFSLPPTDPAELRSKDSIAEDLRNALGVIRLQKKPKAT